MRQAILLLVKSTEATKYDLVQYLASRGVEATASTIDLDIPHVREVCGAIVKFAGSGWNGNQKIGELEFSGNGEKPEYAGIKDWWRKEGSSSVKKLLKDMWHPPAEEKKPAS